MPDNKNNKNNVVLINDSVTVDEKRDYLIHSLQPDNSDFTPPLVSNLNGNAANTTGNNNENK